VIREADTELEAAMVRYNQRSVAELCERSGLRYLGPEGPVFIAGSTRIRSLFVDSDGQYWCDARIVVRSAYFKGPAYDYYEDQLFNGFADDAHDLWIVTEERGRFDAIIARIDRTAEVLHLPKPEPFPQGWCRHWRTLLFMPDAVQLEHAAAGHRGLDLDALSITKPYDPL